MIKLYKLTLHKFIIYLILTGIFAVASSSNVVVIKVGENNTVFSPQNVTLSPGDSIKWVWVAGVHSITSVTVPNNDQSLVINQPLSAANPVIAQKLNMPGTYTFKSIFQTGTYATITVSSPLSNAATVVQHQNIIDIFPNPFNAKLVIDFSNYDYRTTPVVEVYDLVGKLKIHAKFYDQFKDGKMSMETEDLEPGVYFIYIIDNGKKDIYKVIKSANGGGSSMLFRSAGTWASAAGATLNF